MDLESQIAPRGDTHDADGRPPISGASLDQVEVGHCAMILEVQAGESEVEQLMSMGVCVGRRIMLIQAGDPMILKVLGTRIGLSARLARCVRVEPCKGDMFGQAC